MTATRRLARSEAFWGYLFVAPQIVGLLAFVLLPVLGALYLSFSSWKLGQPLTWVGLANYAALVGDDLFWKVLRNTVVYTLGTLVLLVVISLLVAGGLNVPSRLSTTYRAIYFLPSVTSTVALSLVWAWMYNPNFGLINLALASLGIPGPGWVTSVTWAMPAVIIVGVWVGVGYNAVIFLAGLKGVPKELYEAATVDGAGAWARYKDVTLPLLTPTIFFVMVVSTIGAFQVFNIVYLLTKGGPNTQPGGPANSTNVLVLHMFNLGFRFDRLGEAAAVAWVLFLIVAVLTAVQFRFSRWVHYE